MWRLFKKKEKEGFALIMTIIIVAAAFAIIAFALSAVQKSAISTVVNHTKSMQAYYLARSGAAAIAEWIVKHPNKVSKIINTQPATLVLVPGTSGIAKVSVNASTTDNGTKLTIVSTGIVSGAIETLTLELISKIQEGGFKFTKAIVTKAFPSGINGGVGTGGIEYQGSQTLKIGGGGSINGGVISNAPVEVTGGASISGGIIANGNIDISGGGKISGGIIANGKVTIKGGGSIEGGIISNSTSYIGGGSVQDDVISASKVTVDGGAAIMGNVISNSDIDVKNGSVHSGKIESYGNVNLTWSADVKNSEGIVAKGDVLYPKWYNPGTSIATGVSNPFYPGSFPPFPPFPKLTETPLPLPPTGLKNKGSLELPLHHPYTSEKTITESGSYSSIILKGGSMLTINTSNSTLTLFVNNFEVSGGSKINVKGTGTLKLFVNNFIMDGGSEITNSASNNILIYSNNSAGSIEISGGAEIGGNVYIYAPESSFTLKGSTKMKGGVVAKSVDIGGGVSLKPAFLPFRVEGSGGESETYTVGSWWY